MYDLSSPGCRCLHTMDLARVQRRHARQQAEKLRAAAAVEAKTKRVTITAGPSWQTEIQSLLQGEGPPSRTATADVELPFTILSLLFLLPPSGISGSLCLLTWKVCPLSRFTRCLLLSAFNSLAVLIVSRLCRRLHGARQWPPVRNKYRAKFAHR